MPICKIKLVNLIFRRSQMKRLILGLVLVSNCLFAYDYGYSNSYSNSDNDDVIPNHKTIMTLYIHSNSLQYNHNHKVV